MSICRDRFVEVAIVFQRITKIAEGFGQITSECDRLPMGGNRLFKLSLVMQGHAEITVGLGIVWPQGDRLLMSGDRFVQPALVPQRIARWLWASA